jgi:hypothetical protein
MLRRLGMLEKEVKDKQRALSHANMDNEALHAKVGTHLPPSAA